MNKLRLSLIGLGILIILIIWWGISIANGSFYYQEEYNDYTLMVGLQAVLLLIMIGIFIFVNKD